MESAPRVPANDPTRTKNRVEAFAERLAQNRAATWYLIHIGRVVDPFLLRVSKGRSSSAGASSVVVLTHTGAKSGLQRHTPLAYFTDGDDVILVASKGGAPENPAWLFNVRAHPDVELHVGPHGGRYRAREADADERARLWPLANSLYSGYDGYQARTDREIPIVICSPV